MLKVSLVSFALLLATAASGMGKTINYQVNGADYQGFYIKPKSASKGLVLIIHDWDGLTDYEVKRAEMLASQGFEAFALDLYGKGNRPVDIKAKKAETAKLYKDREKMRRLILGGLTEARRYSKKDTVVIGYCFGGAATLELARSGLAKGIKGYASFHGGLKTPAGQSYSKDSGPLFIAHGGADTAVPMADVAQLSEDLEKVGIEYEIEVYSGAPHAFSVLGSSRYHKKADQKSWASFLRFAEERI